MLWMTSERQCARVQELTQAAPGRFPGSRYTLTKPCESFPSVGRKGCSKSVSEPRTQGLGSFKQCWNINSG